MAGTATAEERRQEIETRPRAAGPMNKGEPRGRTLRLHRNEQVYFQTMHPDGSIEWRFRFGRQSVVASADELYQHFARLHGGELFPEAL